LQDFGKETHRFDERRESCVATEMNDYFAHLVWCDSHAQGDTEVALAYPLYRSSDPLCCPGGGTAIVHFQLNNGRLVPLQPIPPTSSKTALSRY